MNSTITRITELAFAPAVAAASTGAGLFELGVQAAAKAAGATAWMMEGLVPGATFVKNFTEQVDHRAAAAREEAFSLAVKGMKTALGTHREEHYNQLAADTAVGPVIKAAARPLTTALDGIAAARKIDTVANNEKELKKTVNAMLDAYSKSGAYTRINTVELRDHFLSMTLGPGGAVLRDLRAIGEGSMRTALGNTRELGESLESCVRAMDYAVGYGAEGLFYPEIPISERLYEAAKAIVDNPPEELIAALRAEDPVGIAAALFRDRDNVLTFSLYYPWALLLVLYDVGNFLATGLRDVNDVEDYVAKEKAILDKKEPKAVEEHQLKMLDKSRPFTITEFEFYVGNAKSKDHPKAVGRLHPHLPPGPFPQATINYAQETAFSYSRLLLSRDEALARIERLYGKRVRMRIQYDPSLYLSAITFRRGLGKTPEAEKHTPESLEQEPLWKLKVRRRRARLQIRSLKGFREDPKTYLPGSVKQRLANRIKVLEQHLDVVRLAYQKKKAKVAAAREAAALDNTQANKATEAGRRGRSKPRSKGSSRRPAAR